MGMDFAQTWLRQMSPPPASHNHFNQCYMWIANRRPEVFSYHGWRDWGGRGVVAPAIMCLGAVIYLDPMHCKLKFVARELLAVLKLG